MSRTIKTVLTISTSVLYLDSSSCLPLQVIKKASYVVQLHSPEVIF